MKRMSMGFRGGCTVGLSLCLVSALVTAKPPDGVPGTPLGGPHADHDGWCQLPAGKAKPPGVGNLAALIGVGEVEANSTPATAQVIPYGDGVGQDRDIDVNGTIATNTDLDYFRITATKGDVLGLAVLAGGAPDSMLAVTDLAGVVFSENDDDQGQGALYPPSSPLPSGINSLDSTLAWIVPADGDYLIRVKSFNGASSGDYTLQLRGPRPFIEQQPPPTTQIIFVDFDGASVNAPALFGSGANPANLSGLSSYMTRWALTAADQNAVIDSILATVNENFDDLRTAALNGNRDSDGINGHFDVEIRNSRDHADPFGQPFVSRLIVGGDIAQLGISTIGIAEDIDPGNFGPEATAVILLDLLSAASPDPNSINSIPRAAGFTKVQAIGRIVGNVSSHEAGHYLGNWHTLNSNATRSIMDAGGNLPINMGGVGADGILGTADDQDVDFSIDAYGGLHTGNERTNVRTAFALATGAGGCTVNGDCDDLQFCNGVETCVTGACVAGTAPNCADAVACTSDSCNEATDSCDHIANNAACGNGLFCDGNETCNATLGCQSGTAPNCDDAFPCTADSCNEGADSCNNTPNNALCDDGLFCNGAETCSAGAGCVAGSDPCGGAGCDEGTGTCLGGTPEIWITFTSSAVIPGVGTVANEDIVAYDPGSGLWSMVFDGSDVGLGSLTIDGMAVLPGGDILLSFSSTGGVPGLTGSPDGTTNANFSDIVRFTPTLLGSTTTGAFSFYFDGSDVGLDSTGENTDAITLAGDGRLIISTSGTFAATGASGADEDLFIFTSTSLGAVTAGSFAMYFDGSDVGLSTSSSEDVDGAGLRAGGNILLSTVGAFSVTGVAGADEDAFQFIPTTLGAATSGTYQMVLDLSALGIDPTENIGSIEEVP